mmetsp:Transcript_68940/g.193409  ORF Transcript_68940/g.193409 Transcript_68940/m.193409 type:complete len:212 (+) Transcript_68940:234-869(+)
MDNNIFLMTSVCLTTHCKSAPVAWPRNLMQPSTKMPLSMSRDSAWVAKSKRSKKCSVSATLRPRIPSLAPNGPLLSRSAKSSKEILPVSPGSRESHNVRSSSYASISFRRCSTARVARSGFASSMAWFTKIAVKMFMNAIWLKAMKKMNNHLYTWPVKLMMSYITDQSSPPVHARYITNIAASTEPNSFMMYARSSGFISSLCKETCMAAP